MENLDLLVKELCKLTDETGWVEFKHNNDEAHMIGEDISALDNIRKKQNVIEIWTRTT